MNPLGLVEALSELARLATTEVDADSMLQRLCVVAGDTFDVDGVGVMITEYETNRFVHATVTQVAPLERLQELLQTGPCRDAAVTGQPVVIDDLTELGPWPDYSALALQLGVNSVIAIPLICRGQTWGVLDLYRLAAGPWSTTDIKAAQTIADVAVSYLVMSADRDSARQSQQLLAHQVMHDPLTGLPNRSLLFDRLQRSLTHARRRNTTVAVLFIDLDRFKAINDTFGHIAGDTVLTTVADRLTTQLRDEDTLGRLAGDEFIWICDDLPGQPGDELDAALGAVTRRVKAIFDAPVRVGNVDVAVSASVGVALTTDGPSPEEILIEADTAMYGAKQRGRGVVVIRDHTRPDSIGYARQLERDLAQALRRNEMAVHFQPIVAARDTDRPVAVEALLRWDRPNAPMLSAAAFIDIAIASGLINSFGAWLVDTSCAQMRGWIDEFGDRAPGTVYVNVSARELGDGNLDTILSTALTDHGLVPGQLGLEVVEDNLADPILMERLALYRKRGHPLSIDDFGTGYSSLSRLFDLPIDIAKIDRSFIDGIPSDSRRVGFIEAVLAVAAKLGIEVIGEGVETEEQLQHLTDAGCHLIQGYLIGRPQPAEQLSATWRLESTLTDRPDPTGT